VSFVLNGIALGYVIPAVIRPMMLFEIKKQPKTGLQCIIEFILLVQ